MKVYHIVADENDWSKSDVKAAHRWTLPGIKCPYCKGTWGITGLSYPSIQTRHLKLTQEKGGLPVGYDEFQKLLKSVRHFLQPNQLIEPGTEFGPLEGKVFGRVGDFAWVHSWYLLIRKESLQQLKKLGFKSPKVVHPELSFGKLQPVNLLEFEIEALASWDVNKLKRAFRCEYCGIFNDGLPDNKLPSILFSSVPKDVDIFRVIQAPAIILATESFKNQVERMKMRNIVFHEITASL